MVTIPLAKKERRSTDVDYRIVAYHPATKEIDVIFDGNPNDWARVSLAETRLGPAPATVEQLEARIQNFTPKKEDIEALAAPFDDALIRSLLNQDRVMPRFSTTMKMEADRAAAVARENELRNQVTMTTAETAPPDAVIVAEETWIESVVLAMAEAGKLDGVIARVARK